MWDVQTIVGLSKDLSAGLCIGLGAIGAALGEGYTAGFANKAISRRPEKSGDIAKSMLVGQAMAESAAIFALVVAVLLLFIDISSAHLLKAFALIGAGLSMGFGAFGSAVGGGYPAAEACLGISRQPAVTGELITNMLIGSAVCQTPAIFAMVISLILMFIGFENEPLHPTWAALIAAGLSTGLSSIGSGIGGGMPAGESCAGIARNPEAAGQITTSMLVGQAVAQTPCIFGLLISFVLIFKVPAPTDSIVPAIALLSAGICMGLGGIGPGIGNGFAAQGAVKWIARRLEAAGTLTRVMLVGQAVSQSTAIYAMVVSLVLIFVL